MKIQIISIDIEKTQLDNYSQENNEAQKKVAQYNPYFQLSNFVSVVISCSRNNGGRTFCGT